MQFRIVASLLCGGLLAFAATDAAAATGPCKPPYLCADGVRLVIRDSAGEIVGRGETGADGAARIRVAVGDVDGDGTDEYTIEVDGESFVKAADRFDLDKPAKRDATPSVTLGVGGFLGGGRSRSGREGGSHGGSHSGGGVGVGLSIPLGGGHGDDPEAPAGYPITSITISLPANPDANTANRGSTTSLTFKAPYCRDAAVHGTRIGFTMPGGRNPVVLVSMSIFDRWGNL